MIAQIEKHFSYFPGLECLINTNKLKAGNLTGKFDDISNISEGVPCKEIANKHHSGTATQWKIEE